MDAITILKDLKKLSGPIQGITINDHHGDKSKILTAYYAPAQSTQKEMTMNQIEALIKYPFKLYSDGPIDNAIVKIECGIKHRHEYLVRDVVDLNGAIKCITCNVSNQFVNLVRETAEGILKVPLCIIGPMQKNQSYKLHNDDIKLIIECCKMGQPTKTFVQDNDILCVQISRTSSAKKVREWLLREMHANIKRFKNLDIGVYSDTFIEGQLPYTLETARMAIAARKANPSLINQMKIVPDDKMCIENCQN